MDATLERDGELLAHGQAEEDVGDDAPGAAEQRHQEDTGHPQSEVARAGRIATAGADRYRRGFGRALCHCSLRFRVSPWRDRRPREFPLLRPAPAPPPCPSDSPTGPASYHTPLAPDFPGRSMMRI